MTNNQTEHEHGDEALENAEGGVHRLLDILTQEVSIVNRAANKREWLVRKGSEGMDPTVNETEETREEDETVDAPVEKQMSMPGPVKAAVLQAAEGIAARMMKLHEALKAATEEDGAPVPPMVHAEMKAFATNLQGLLSRYPSPKKKEDDSDGDGEKTEKSLPHIDDPKETDKKKTKEAIVLPTGMKAKLVSAVEQAHGLLMSCIKDVKAATEATETDAAPMPPELTKKIEAIIAGLMGMVDGMLAPKSEDKDEKKTEDKEEKEEEEVDKKAGTPDSIVKEVRTALNVVMAKIKPGQPIDEDSFQRLQRIMSMIDGAGSTSGQKDDDPQDANKAGSETDVEKAGAKMALKRRKKFQDALKVLIDLFKEIMPPSQLGKMPHLQVHKAADTSEIDELKTKLEKAEEDLNSTRRELSDLKSRPEASAVTPIESINEKPSGDGNVDWPMDMNS